MGTRKWNNVYIAAASSDIERVKRVRAQLVGGGIIVTSRWIDEVDKTGANPDDDNERRRRAKADVADLDSSDVILFLVPGCDHYVSDRLMATPQLHVTRGAWWECGYMYRAGKPIVSCGTRAELRRSVFPALGEEFENDVDGVIRILRVPIVVCDSCHGEHTGACSG